MTVLEVIAVIGSWLAPCWAFFELPFPLFGIRIADIYIGLALAAIGIRVIKRAIDSPESPADASGSIRGIGDRISSNRADRARRDYSSKWFG